MDTQPLSGQSWCFRPLAKFLWSLSILHCDNGAASEHLTNVCQMCYVKICSEYIFCRNLVGIYFLSKFGRNIGRVLVELRMRHLYLA